MNRKTNFDSVAWCYDFLAQLVFGSNIKRSQLVLLNHIKNNSKVLIIGGGTGWIIKELLAVKQVLQIDYVDSSLKMLDKARSINSMHTNTLVKFIHGDENAVQQDAYYDVVLACYFFDLFPLDRLEDIVFKLTNSLKRDGSMLVADFMLNAKSTIVQRLLLKVMYLFFNVLCSVEAKSLAPLAAVFKKNGLERTNSVNMYGGFIRSEVYIKQ